VTPPAVPLAGRPLSDATDTGAGVGLLVAAAMAPGTFTPSLLPRSAADQGMVTGLAVGLHYLLAVGAQDALQAVARGVAHRVPVDGDSDAASREAALIFAADLAMIPLAGAVRAALPVKPDEAMWRGWLRQSAWRVEASAFGGALLVTAHTSLRLLDEAVGARGRLAALPVAVPLGLGVAYVQDRRAARSDDEAPGEPTATPAAVRSLAIATGVVGGLAAAGYGERALADGIGRALAARLPGSRHLWSLAGHGANLALLAVGTSTFWARAMRKIEASTSADEPLFGEDEGARWTGPTLSGGPGSLVSWESLGREGRRHVLAHVRPHPLVDRPKDLPDLSIETVMGVAAKAAPTQVYVGLDSAGSPRERVDLALAELERCEAFDRSLLMLVSPTGTGYVNYAAVAAAEYLTLGDVATVTMQYSKRPSPLSLRMIKTAREQNRLLWLKILQRISERSRPRPKVVLFGESLGAHTSQDVFLHWGTLGLEALGIDRALWIGTPYGSEWMRQVTGPGRLDVDLGSVGIFNDYAQLAALDPDRRAQLRYALVSHDNDGVTKFGLDLLSSPPPWLGSGRPPVEKIDGASPRGVPSTIRWRPITSFFQGLVDMKNAQQPGQFTAWAHDYRADLTLFVNDVFDLGATPAQLAAVEAAVMRREMERERLFAG
jgi:uncharacterized membrane protein